MSPANNPSLPPFQIDIVDGNIPVPKEYLKPPLLLCLECLLVREERLCERRFVKSIVGHLHILENDGYAVVPSSILRRVEAGLHGAYLENSAKLDLFLQYREVVLLEQLNELVSVPPTDLIIILHDIWPVD